MNGTRQLIDLATIAGITWLLWFGLAEQRLPMPNGEFLVRQEDALAYWAFIAIISVAVVASFYRLLLRLLPSPGRSG